MNITQIANALNEAEDLKTQLERARKLNNLLTEARDWATDIYVVPGAELEGHIRDAIKASDAQLQAIKEKIAAKKFLSSSV